MFISLFVRSQTRQNSSRAWLSEVQIWKRTEGIFFLQNSLVVRSATPWWDQQHTNAFQVKGWGRQLPICMFSVTQAICPLCFSLLFHMSFVLLTHNCGLTSKPINLLDYRMSRHHTPCFSSSSIQLKITNRNFPTMEAWGSKSTSIHCQQWESENEA